MEIRLSTVKGAGKGVFASVDIEQNTLIMSYIGTVSTNLSCDLTSDSNFHLGWFTTNKVSKELIINTDRSCNAARFINNWDKDHPENCTPVIGVADKELTVVLVATKQIKKGEELFYEYGDSYWNSDKQLE